MSTDTTPEQSLINDLLIAAWSEMKDPPYSNWSYGELPERAKHRVKRTVAAVLRQLDEAASGTPEYAVEFDFEGLADMVIDGSGAVG